MYSNVQWAIHPNCIAYPITLEPNGLHILKYIWTNLGNQFAKLSPNAHFINIIQCQSSSSAEKCFFFKYFQMYIFIYKDGNKMSVL